MKTNNNMGNQEQSLVLQSKMLQAREVISSTSPTVDDSRRQEVLLEEEEKKKKTLLHRPWMPRNSMPTSIAMEDVDEDFDPDHVAASETKFVRILRMILVILLMSVTVLVSMAVYRITQNDERLRFENHVNIYSKRIVQDFHTVIAQRLGVISAMATAMTSHALATNQSFPLFTLPHFELRGSVLRVQADSHAIHYMPVVQDHQRAEWEAYALQHRFQIDEAFASDTQHRNRQDEALGYNKNKNNRHRRQQENPETIVQDGTGFHERIWSNGAVTPKGDEAEGTGPFLPLWQRSPINGARQRLLNMNFANTRAMEGVLQVLMETKEAVINKAAFPIPSQAENMRENFALSQFRHENFETYGSDAGSFFAYPIMDSFEANAQVAGVLATNMYWRLIFSHALPAMTGSFVVVLENSFNQTLSYRLDGPNVVFLGDADYHDETYNDLMTFLDLNKYYADRLSNAAWRSYTSVPLSKDFGKYTLRVYPTRETEEMFTTSKRWLYTGTVVVVAFSISCLFGAFVYFVERRQRIVTKSMVQHANKAALAERDLNEFLAHEIRNPLASAMVAHSFVTSAMAESNLGIDENTRLSIAADQKIVTSSLTFIDDFLRSMLLMYRANTNKLDMGLSQTNLYKQVFEPVGDIISPRNDEIEVSIECPKDLEVMTDCLRLQQILLNLGRNASKCVRTGFIRLKASVCDGSVLISCEDSGPGFPEEMRKFLFGKYHTSLDVATKGNGIGLSFCQKLVHLLKGEIMLDESYKSGIPGSPGARFVVRLNEPPIYSTPSIELESPSAHSTRPAAEAEADEISYTTTACEHILPERLSVLFVDDDAILRKLFIRSVRKVCPGWTVEGASSAEGAIELIFGSSDQEVDEEQGALPIRHFDLIFMDQYMADSGSSEPRLLGTEAVAAMRARGVMSKICGLSANKLNREFIACGADFFLLKPLPVDKKALEAELVRVAGCLVP